MKGMITNIKHPAFRKLPPRLTISFPLWLIYGTRGEYSPYYDIDRVMREHVERGFNCIRIDSGAGLIHDLDGNLREPFVIDSMFGEYERIPRQQRIVGDGGSCDLLARLVETMECARKYGIYVILSQWYYLHTYWFHGAGDPVADELFSIPSEKRVEAFGKFWHYILLELEKWGPDDRIAFVELFNEANEHPYMCGERLWGPDKNISDEEEAAFGRQHAEALAFLQREHPQIIFAYDAVGPHHVKETMPENAQVYNFHAYYLWSIYHRTMREHPEWFQNRVNAADVMTARANRRPVDPEWYERIAKHSDIRPECLPEIEAALEQKLTDMKEHYREELEERLREALTFAEGRPLVCGEGVSYIASKEILWEERSEQYWVMVKYGLKRFKEAGVWGSVIRTCCGPEDPCWTLYADKLLELNRFFLE